MTCENAALERTSVNASVARKVFFTGTLPPNIVIVLFLFRIHFFSPWANLDKEYQKKPLTKIPLPRSYPQQRTWNIIIIIALVNGQVALLSRTKKGLSYGLRGVNSPTGNELVVFNKISSERKISILFVVFSLTFCRLRHQSGGCKGISPRKLAIEKRFETCESNKTSSNPSTKKPAGLPQRGKPAGYVRR